MCPEFLGTVSQGISRQMRETAAVMLSIYHSVPQLRLSSTLMAFVTMTERINSQIQATTMSYFLERLSLSDGVITFSR